MIDAEGFRLNVGIIISNNSGQVFWGKRLGIDAWQFPQGGIKRRESLHAAMYRELKEETGLKSQHVKVLGFTNNWLRYWLPEKFIRYNNQPVCIGQKQIWYLLQLIADEYYVNLKTSQQPEFELWKWVDFSTPVKEVIAFKREVYQQALQQLEPVYYQYQK